MPKSDDGPPWFKRITGQIVGMCRGMVTLTRTDDGEHTLWLYDQPIATGDARTMRHSYADYLDVDPGGEWLAKFYRN